MDPQGRWSHPAILCTAAAIARPRPLWFLDSLQVEPPIRYAPTTDGASIAYWSHGAGPTLVQTPLLPYSHIQREWHNPHIRDWYEHLGTAVNVVRYDARGNGMSSRDAGEVDIEAHVRDLTAVMERLGEDPVAIMGVFHSGPAAILYAARNPERVSHLILWCTYANGADYWKAARAEGLRALRQTDYEMFLLTGAHELLGWSKNEESALFAELMRVAVTPDEADRLLAATRGFDAEAALPEIRCPTLVIHRRDLSWIDVGLSRDMAARIPEARLLIVEGSSPYPAAGEVEPLVAAVHEFIGVGHGHFEPAAGGFRTVLFTDLVDHTRMIASMGDDAGREILREHEAITRELLRQNGGTEIKALGDGFMASFRSATQAVRCAIALQKRIHARNLAVSKGAPQLSVRIGINAGEPIEEAGDLFGASVIMASRIASSAGGGQIRVAGAVRDLVAGKGFGFLNPADITLKGFEEPVRVWDVDWGGSV